MLFMLSWYCCLSVLEATSCSWLARNTIEAVPADIRDYTTFADGLTVADASVFKGNRVVVPHGTRDDILARLHISHSGVNGFCAVPGTLPWHSSRHYKKLVSQCHVCQNHQVESAKESLRSYPVPSRPWERVGTRWSGLGLSYHRAEPLLWSRHTTLKTV